MTEILNYPATAPAEKDLTDIPWAGREPTISEDPITLDLDRMDEDSITKEPTPQEQRKHLRVHRHLGHPKNEDMAPALRRDGAKKRAPQPEVRGVSGKP